MNLNFLPQYQQLLFLQLGTLQGHHVKESLVRLVPTVDEGLEVAGVRVGQLAAPQHVGHQVLVAQLGRYHHRVVTCHENISINDREKYFKAQQNIVLTRCGVSGSIVVELEAVLIDGAGAVVDSCFQIYCSGGY